MQEALDTFFLAIHSRYDIEQPAAKRLLRRKLNVINKLKNEKQQLADQLKRREKLIRSLAVEYNMMGKECEEEGMTDAAMRNYEKALALCPDYLEPGKRLKKIKKTGH